MPEGVPGFLLGKEDIGGVGSINLNDGRWITKPRVAIVIRVAKDVPNKDGSADKHGARQAD
jgi:hypothetical protein